MHCASCVNRVESALLALDGVRSATVSLSPQRATVELVDDQLTDARCILTVEKLRHKAEGTLFVSGGKIHAEFVADDMYAAIDGLIDRLDRRAKKHRDKQNDHHVREAHRQRMV